MTYSKNALAMTESFEGCRLQAYQDSTGVWTIGYGHTRGVFRGMTCSQAQAETWLEEDVRKASHAVEMLVHVQLTQGEFDALTDFAFNCGPGKLLGSTMLRKLNAGDYAGAAAEFVKWDKAGGVVVAGLLRRRYAEQKEFLS